MNVRRFATIAAALAVGAIAAVASYAHMRHLALQYGQTPPLAAMLPLSVDGMMVVATVALGDGRRYRWSAWLAFWMGVAASVIANVLAAEPSAIARCISAWPAIAFLLVVEVVTRGGRGRSTELVVDEPPVAAEEPVLDEPEPVDEALSDDAPSDTPPEPHPTAVKIAALRKRYPRITQQKAAQRLDLGLRTVQRHWPDAVPADASPTSTPEPVNGRVPELEGVPS